MQNETTELVPEQTISPTDNPQNQNEDIAEQVVASTPPMPSSPPPRPPSSPPPQSSQSELPSRPLSPPPRPSQSELSPRPPPPKPPSSPTKVVLPVTSLPPAGRPSITFGPPPSRPSSCSSATSSAPPVAIRDLWMGSAGLVEEEEEAGEEGDEGDQPEDEDQEEGDDGPVDRQGRPIRSAADVKKKRGGGGASFEQAAATPFAFVPLDSVSFATGVAEKPKASPAKPVENEVKTAATNNSSSLTTGLEDNKASSSSASFTDAMGALSLSSTPFVFAAGSTGEFNFGSAPAQPSNNAFAFSLPDFSSSNANTAASTATVTQVSISTQPQAAKPLETTGGNSNNHESVSLNSPSTTLPVTAASTSVNSSVMAGVSSSFNSNLSVSTVPASQSSVISSTSPNFLPNESKESKQADDDEKSGPVDKYGRPIRAAADVKKKRTPGGGGGGGGESAPSNDSSSTIPFIFAPMHLRTSEGFVAGNTSENSGKKINKKGTRSPASNNNSSSSSSFASSFSAGGDNLPSFSDAAAASLGSFSFSSSVGSSSDFISPFSTGFSGSGPLFGGESKQSDFAAAAQHAATSLGTGNAEVFASTPSREQESLGATTSQGETEKVTPAPTETHTQRTHPEL